MARYTTRIENGEVIRERIYTHDNPLTDDECHRLRRLLRFLRPQSIANMKFERENGAHLVLGNNTIERLSRGEWPAFTLPWERRYMGF